MTNDKATALREADELLRLARNAHLDGVEWHLDGAPTDEVIATDRAACVSVVAKINPMGEWTDDTAAAWAAYIAAAHPARIIALLAERERLRGALEAAHAVLKAYNLATAEVVSQALEATHDQ